MIKSENNQIIKMFEKIYNFSHNMNIILCMKCCMIYTLHEMLYDIYFAWNVVWYILCMKCCRIYTLHEMLYDMTTDV